MSDTESRRENARFNREEDKAFRAQQPNDPVPAFDKAGEPIIHRGPRIPPASPVSESGPVRIVDGSGSVLPTERIVVDGVEYYRLLLPRTAPVAGSEPRPLRAEDVLYRHADGSERFASGKLANLSMAERQRLAKMLVENSAPAVSPSGGAPTPEEWPVFAEHVSMWIAGNPKTAQASGLTIVWQMLQSERAARLAAEKARDTWREVAEHVRGCVECSMGDVMDCSEGKELWDATAALHSPESKR